MIVWQILGSIISLFPVSFFAFLVAERVLVTHQSRVGIGQSWLGFFKQGGINLGDLLGKPSSLISVLVVAVQFSFLALIPFFNSDLETYSLKGGFLFCLLINLMVLMVQGFYSTYSSDSQALVESRIQNDQRMMKTALGSVIALVCLCASFSLGNTWSVSELIQQQVNSPLHWGIFWSPIHILFFVLYQISGMMLFDEHPFSSGFNDFDKEYTLVSSAWIQSARYYVWSLLGAVIYLGGGVIFGDEGSILSFITLQLKGFAIYLLFKLLGLYFPRHAQSETYKVAFLFLIPISLVALVFVFMLRGVQGG